MSNSARSDLFIQFVGLQLKGRIVSQGFTAKDVAEAIGRSPAAFNRWLNGKADTPLPVLCDACEVIGVNPTLVVDEAYRRMVSRLGDWDGEATGTNEALPLSIRDYLPDLTHVRSDFVVAARRGSAPKIDHDDGDTP